MNSCKCQRSETVCGGCGHRWHKCLVHNTIVDGHADHSVQGCTCPEKMHAGSTLDSFLEEEGIIDEATEVAKKRVLMHRLSELCREVAEAQKGSECFFGLMCPNCKNTPAGQIVAVSYYKDECRINCSCTCGEVWDQPVILHPMDEDKDA